MGEQKDDTRSEVGLNRLAIVCALVTISISGLAIAGWLLNWLIIARISPEYIPMAPSTSIFFLISGAALLAYSYQPANLTARKFARAGAAFILIICFIILVDYLAGSGFDIERILLPTPGKFDQVPVGRMSPITATSFVLSGSALLLLLFSPEGKQRTKGIAAYLATIVLSVGIVILLGYLYGTPLLYGGTIIPVALTTAIAFVFLSFGLITAAGPDYLPLRLFIGHSVRARLMRAFLPITIAFIVIDGWLHIVVFSHATNLVLESSILVILSLVIIGSIISKIAEIVGSDIDRANVRRREAEEALRENKERLNFALEGTNDGIWDVQMDTGAVYMSPRGCEILGYHPEELPNIAETWDQLVNPDDLPATRAALNAYLEGRVPIFDVEQRLRTKSGEWKWIRARGKAVVRDASGSPTRMVGTHTDITERKKAEGELRLKQHMLSEAQRIAHIGSWDANIATGKITWSDEMYRIYGVSPDTFEVTVEAFVKLIHPDDQAAMLRWVKATISGKKEPELDFRILLSDGAVRFIRGAGELFFDETGNPIRVIGTAQDITERKKAEEIRLENERLAAADKAKSEFLANMSHELRTPLNASMGFSEFLKLGMAGELSEKQKHYVDNILTSNQFLLTLINDILDLSKVEAGRIELAPEKMSVPVTIKETLSLIKEKAMKHNVLLKTEFNPELEFIEADKQRFKQILFNLISNAVKFSKEEGGTVTITAKKVDENVQISVSDTGIGIKPESMGKLFQKFEQLEKGIPEKYGGTGLGLAISKELVELHGGRIWAESKYGEGSTFTFLLPLKAKKGDE